MSYAIILSARAREALGRWPAPLRQYVGEQLLRLAANPTALSRRSVSPPYPPDCQMFQPDPIEHGGREHEFTFLFRFSQDETSLRIVGIGHIERDPDQ